MQPEREEILRIEHITKRFPIAGGKVLTACDDVTFPVYKGELLGIVGESGCGKSTLVRTLMQLHAPSEGQIFFRGQEITGLKGEEARNMRRNIQMVFQDPNTAFNPKMKIKDIICEPLRNFGLLKGSARDKAAELLRLVDLPAILVCDEATSALDVSVQEKIVELLIRIQKERDLTILFICHDLALVSMLCTRVVVMYFGKVVEELDGKDLAHAKHRYTQKLLKSVFSLLPKGKAPRIDLSDDVPSPEDQEAAG